MARMMSVYLKTSPEDNQDTSSECKLAALVRNMHGEAAIKGKPANVARLHEQGCRLQARMRREGLDRLPHRQVGHDLLAAAVDRGHLVDTVEGLHDAAHACHRDTAPAEDLNGIVRDKVAHASGGVLEQRDAPADLCGLWAHLVHGMGDLIAHGGQLLESGEHLRELFADHGLLHQLRAEHLALHSPLEDFLGAQAGSLDAHHADHPTLVVEV
mmetsp:Transcript_67135/g.216943  ORF Transcript_67135/g.216943 Transcript_67135/m.216943 type:complete len:213 (-) Transcript_67135:1148-1786(-)